MFLSAVRLESRGVLQQVSFKTRMPTDMRNSVPFFKESRDARCQWWCRWLCRLIPHNTHDLQTVLELMTRTDISIPVCTPKRREDNLSSLIPLFVHFRCRTCTAPYVAVTVNEKPGDSLQYDSNHTTPLRCQMKKFPTTRRKMTFLTPPKLKIVDTCRSQMI